MIVRRGFDLLRLAGHVGPLLLALLAYDVMVTVAYVLLDWHWLAIEDLPLPLLGSAIVLVVTLRNNAAYNRWWEARTLWGAVVNNSRSLARGLTALIDDDTLRNSIIRQQIAYALALRCHLLRLKPWAEIDGYLSAGDAAGLRDAANVPAALQTTMGAALAQARRGGALDSIAVATLDRTLSELANAQGGLERIKNTPLPRQYNHFPQIFIRVYCVLLPLGLVHDLGILTPIGSTVIGFMFLALDQIGRDLEDPFENTLHDVPTRAITRTIEIDLLQSMGTDTPPPIGIEDGVLW
jgi:putative membrane protein